jgi:beta-lactamase class A
VLVVLAGAGLHLEASRRATAQAAVVAEISNQQTLQAGFTKSINEIIAQNPQLDLSVAITGSSTETPKIYGNASSQDAASTAKLITAIAFLHKVETGKTGLNYKINDQSAITELRLLINQSDEAAWAAFNDKLGHPYLQSYMKSLGIKSYSAELNQISSGDMARLASLLYGGKLLAATHTKLLLGYMQHTNFEDFISPALVPGARFYHKVGIDADQINDVGIIAKDQKSFAISVFTNGRGSYDWPARANLIQQIAKAAQSAYL